MRQIFFQGSEFCVMESNEMAKNCCQHIGIYCVYFLWTPRRGAFFCRGANWLAWVSFCHVCESIIFQAWKEFFKYTLVPDMVAVFHSVRLAGGWCWFVMKEKYYYLVWEKTLLSGWLTSQMNIEFVVIILALLFQCLIDVIREECSPCDVRLLLAEITGNPRLEIRPEV